ncbi:DUF4258 domain-containing protein [Candidatus Micrarchaeota archaeon]|nr:DUF4258 domain-containing protein [Candidatus Micrarchaeota archaeon]
MKLVIINHALERMTRYLIREDLLLSCLENPDKISDSYGDRKIFQKKINGYVLRVIVEEKEGIKTVITLYKAKSERYEI